MHIIVDQLYQQSHTFSLGLNVVGASCLLVVEPRAVRVVPNVRTLRMQLLGIVYHVDNSKNEQFSNRSLFLTGFLEYISAP